jgi:hypothetical protein
MTCLCSHEEGAHVREARLHGKRTQGCVVLGCGCLYFRPAPEPRAA